MERHSIYAFTEEQRKSRGDSSLNHQAEKRQQLSGEGKMSVTDSLVLPLVLQKNLAREMGSQETLVIEEMHSDRQGSSVFLRLILYK